MPSPFPGMDPFLEGQRWQDFHARFAAAAIDRLVAQVRPRYAVTIEEHLYPIGTEPGDLIRRDSPSRQRRLVLSPMTDRRTVTVVEHLVPWNKCPRTRDEYLRRRRDLLDDGLNVMEIDLLRGGERLPMIAEVPGAHDYFVIVIRAKAPDRMEVWPWSLRDRMPTIPVPLAPPDADVVLDLQAVFDELYDRAGYDYALNYDMEVTPPLSDTDQAWVEELLRGRRR